MPSRGRLSRRRWTCKAAAPGPAREHLPCQRKHPQGRAPPLAQSRPALQKRSRVPAARARSRGWHNRGRKHQPAHSRANPRPARCVRHRRFHSRTNRSRGHSARRPNLQDRASRAPARYALSGRRPNRANRRAVRRKPRRVIVPRISASRVHRAILIRGNPTPNHPPGSVRLQNRLRPNNRQKRKHPSPSRQKNSDLPCSPTKKQPGAGWLPPAVIRPWSLADQMKNDRITSTISSPEARTAIFSRSLTTYA